MSVTFLLSYHDHPDHYCHPYQYRYHFVSIVVVIIIIIIIVVVIVVASIIISLLSLRCSEACVFAALSRRPFAMAKMTSIHRNADE